MIIDGKHYESIVSRYIFDDIDIVIDNEWESYYVRGGRLLNDEYFKPPTIINLALICIKHEFDGEEFNDDNIRKFKKRFEYLIQYNNKMELQILVNQTLLKLEDFIKTNLRKVRMEDGEISR